MKMQINKANRLKQIVSDNKNAYFQSMSDSKANILQNTGILNDTVTSPVDLSTSYTKPNKKFSITNILSKTSLDLGQFNDSKLSHLYSPDNSQKGEVICLAFIDKNKDLAITPQAINLFKQYQKNAITFVGNFGKKDSGKSFWYDKILHLSQVQGAQYSKIQNVPGLYIWSVPFVKNNLRIFLVDYLNHKEGDGLSGQDEKLLDLQLILAEALVLIPDPSDKKSKIVDSAYTNFNSAMGRLSDKGSKTSKDTGYWPHSLYSLLRSTKSVTPQTDKLSYLFTDYNYSIIHDALNNRVRQSVSQLQLMESSLVKGESSSKILNELYVKRTAMIFKDIYRKLNGKKYEGLQFTGRLLPYILGHSVKNLNSSKNVKMDKMFYEIKKEIYEKKLQNGKFIFNVNYNHLKDIEEPQSPSKSSLKQSRKAYPNETSMISSQKQSKSIIKVGAGGPQPSQSRFKSLLQDSSPPQSQQHLLAKPKPLPLDHLINIFQTTTKNVLTDFNQTKEDPVLHQQYEKKLLDYGQVKQRQVLKYNKQQTYHSLTSTLPTFHPTEESPQVDSQAILTYLATLKTSGLPLDHDRCNPVAQKLKDVCAHTKRLNYFHVWMTEAHYKQRKLEMGLDDKKKQLNDLKFNKNAALLLNTHQDQQADEYRDQHNRSTDKIQKIRSEIDLNKKVNKNGITDEEHIKELQKYKKRLEDTLKENDRKVREYNLTPSKDARVSILQQKLDDKRTMQLQIQAGLSNIVQSRLNHSESVLSSRRSQIRRIGDGGIKKSHLNKSMTK